MTQTIAEALAEREAERTGKPVPAATPKHISADQAAEIAKEYGLGLTDAAALKQMASSADEARRIAKTFQPEHLRQLTREDVHKLRVEGRGDELLKAQADGRLRDFETAKEEKRPEGQLGAEAVRKLTPAQIEEAMAEGKLEWIMTREPSAP